MRRTRVFAQHDLADGRARLVNVITDLDIMFDQYNGTLPEIVLNVVAV